MIKYLKNKFRCRRQIILEYFEEIDYEKCFKCDNCKQIKQYQNTQNIESEILNCFDKGITKLDKIISYIGYDNKEIILDVLHKLIFNQKIRFNYPNMSFENITQL